MVQVENSYTTLAIPATGCASSGFNGKWYRWYSKSTEIAQKWESARGQNRLIQRHSYCLGTGDKSGDKIVSVRVTRKREGMLKIAEKSNKKGFTPHAVYTATPKARADAALGCIPCDVQN